MQNQPKYLIILLVGVLGLSTSAIFARMAEAPSSILAFYRLLVTVVLLLPYALSNRTFRVEWRHLTKRDWALGMGAGLFLALHYVLWFESLHFTSVASSTVIVTLQPLFSVAIGRILFREKYTAKALGGILIAIVGSCFIGWGDFQAGGTALLGDGLAFLAAGVIVAYFFFGQVLRKRLSAVPYSLMGYVSSSVFLAGYALLRVDSFTGYPVKTWLCFLGIAVVSTIFGQMILNWLLRWLNATTIATGVLSEPVFASVLSMCILHEPLRPSQVVGMGVILSGLVIFSCSQRPCHTASK